MSLRADNHWPAALPTECFTKAKVGSGKVGSKWVF